MAQLAQTCRPQGPRLRPATCDIRLIVVIFLAFAVGASGARADSVYLKNGRAIHNVHARVDGEQLVIS